MSESPWKGGWGDWWSANRGWLLRGLFVPPIGTVAGYFLGRSMHFPSWASSLGGGLVGLLLWAAVGFFSFLSGAPKRALERKNETLKARDDRIRELEAAREAEIAKRPNLTVEFTDESKIIHMKISNSGGRAEELNVKVDSDLTILRGTRHLTGSGISLLGNDSHTFVVASARAMSGDKITEWRLHLDEHEPTISMARPIRISITCHPENRGGPIQWQLTFHETGVDKQPITPASP